MIEYSKGVLNDIDTMMTINRENLPEHYERNTWLTWFLKYPSLFRVAKDGDKMVGYTVCIVVENEAQIQHLDTVTPLIKGGVGYVVSTAVIPEYRRQGIAKTLLGTCLNEMMDMGVVACRLQVRVNNGAAQRLYQKYGFKLIGFLPGYYSNPMDNGYLLEKRLV